MGGLVVYEEVLFLRSIGRVVFATLGEVILQLLHQLSVSSEVGSAQHCHSEVFIFVASAAACFSTSVGSDDSASSSFSSPGSVPMALP